MNNKPQTTTLIKSKFSIAGDDRSFEGYHIGITWNGWDCPMFTKEMISQIIETYSTTEYPLSFDGDFSKTNHTSQEGEVLYTNEDSWTWVRSKA